MIKSILEDEEPPEESPKEKRGLLKGRRPKEDLLSIRPSSSDADAEASSEETEVEIRNGILGIPGPGPEPEAARAKETDKESSEPEDESGTASPESSDRTAELEKMLKELEIELEREKKEVERRTANRYAGKDETLPEAIGASDALAPGFPQAGPETTPLSVADDEPVSTVEIFRRMGLAWSAAIALFGSVVFMLAIGWVADVLLGSSPWGIVTGIVIGAVIGFFQLFRITSLITGRRPDDFERLSLKASRETDPPDKGPEVPGGEETGPDVV